MGSVANATDQHEWSDPDACPIASWQEAVCEGESAEPGAGRKVAGIINVGRSGNRFGWLLILDVGDVVQNGLGIDITAGACGRSAAGVGGDRDRRLACHLHRQEILDLRVR